MRGKIVMKYYERHYTKREPINHFGKLGFVGYVAYVKTDNIDPFNKYLKNRFYEIKRNKILLHAKVNQIVEMKEE